MNNDFDNQIDQIVQPITAAPLPADALQWAQVLNDNIARIMSTMNITMGAVDTIATEVRPLVDMVSNSPLVKMMGGKR